MLRFDNNENGGTIIDSGSTITDFPVAIYNHIVGEFASHSGYIRARKVEVDSGFGLCYTLSSVEDVKFGVEEVKFLEFAFWRMLSLVWRKLSFLSFHFISRVAFTSYCLMRILSSMGILTHIALQ